MRPTLRLFVALPIPNDLIARLITVQQQLEQRVPRKAVRWSRTGQLHLTLKFLGNVDRDRVGDLEAALAAAGARIPPLDLSFKGVGAFPNSRQPRVLWAGMAGDIEALTLLQHDIEKATAGFGDPREQRGFRPHLTIGRVVVRNSRQARAVGEALETFELGHLGDWRATRVHLIRSQLLPQGAIHSDLAVIDLCT